MKRQTTQIENSLTPAALAARINSAANDIITHYEIPAGAATKPAQLPYMINPAGETLPAPQSSSELSFGAPQIDLALAPGCLISAGLHQFNPRHFRDQALTLKCALALAARRITAEKSDPIFCFVSQDQSELIGWLSETAATTLGIENDQLVIVTAKHSDDLLWAIEETMHGAAATAIVAHVPLVDNLCAQRIAFTARTKGVPALIVTNHRINGPDHAASSWSIDQVATAEQDQSTEIAANLTITHSKETVISNQSAGVKSWSIKWHPDRHRFTAKSSPVSQAPAPTIH